MDIESGVIDCGSVVVTMSMNEITQKESLLNRMSKRNIKNPQYLNWERSRSVQRELSKGVQIVREKQSNKGDLKAKETVQKREK